MAGGGNLALDDDVAPQCDAHWLIVLVLCEQHQMSAGWLASMTVDHLARATCGALSAWYSSCVPADRFTAERNTQHTHTTTTSNRTQHRGWCELVLYCIVVNLNPVTDRHCTVSYSTYLLYRTIL